MGYCSCFSRVPFLLSSRVLGMVRSYRLPALSSGSCSLPGEHGQLLLRHKQTKRFPTDLSSAPKKEKRIDSYGILQVSMISVVQAQLNFTVFWGCWEHKVLLSWISRASLPTPARLLSRRHDTIQYLHVLNKTPSAFAGPGGIYFCYSHIRKNLSVLKKKKVFVQVVRR